MVTSVGGPGGALGASEGAQFELTLISAKLRKMGPAPGAVVVVAGLTADEVADGAMVEAVFGAGVEAAGVEDAAVEDGAAEDGAAVVDDVCDPGGAVVELPITVAPVTAAVVVGGTVVAVLEVDEVQLTSVHAHAVTIESFRNMTKRYQAGDR